MQCSKLAFCCPDFMGKHLCGIIYKSSWGDGSGINLDLTELDDL